MSLSDKIQVLDGRDVGEYLWLKDVKEAISQLKESLPIIITEGFKAGGNLEITHLRCARRIIQIFGEKLIK